MCLCKVQLTFCTPSSDGGREPWAERFARLLNSTVHGILHPVSLATKWRPSNAWCGLPFWRRTDWTVSPFQQWLHTNKTQIVGVWRAKVLTPWPDSQFWVLNRPWPIRRVVKSSENVMQISRMASLFRTLLQMPPRAEVFFLGGGQYQKSTAHVGSPA